MVTNDATLVRLKHRIMEETAKLAWEGNLDDEKLVTLEVADF